MKRVIIPGMDTFKGIEEPFGPAKPGDTPLPEYPEVPFGPGLPPEIPDEPGPVKPPFDPENPHWG